MKKLTGTTLLLGNNETTGRILEDLADSENRLILATPQDNFHFSAHAQALIQSREASIKALTAATVAGCRGTVGNFHIRMHQGKERFICRVDRIVLCEDLHRDPGFAVYGLTPSPHILSLSQVIAHIDPEEPSASIPDQYQKVVFLMGLKHESHPVIAADVMDSALHLQQQGKQVYILTGNLKVAAPGLEKRYRECRKAGVVFVKFTQAAPDFRSKADGRVVIEYKDELLDQRFRLSPDLAVVDETFAPFSYLRHLTRIFNLESDASGFAQADNVHRLTVLTNRKGILAAGTSRSILSKEDRWIDAHNTVLTAAALHSNAHDQDNSFAEIDPGGCVRCLTCYRVCPYRAVVVNARPRIEPDACEACGICIAECPREAIQFKGDARPFTRTALDPSFEIPEGKPLPPVIAAFCCTRSALQAKKLAVCRGDSLPEGLICIEVPCAGSISHSQLMTAFQQNADGVLVLACHNGNCHSEKGSRLADSRVRYLKTMMEQMGFEPRRLMIQTLAANMGIEFVQIVNAFEERLKALGPSRLKASASAKTGP